MINFNLRIKIIEMEGIKMLKNKIVNYMQWFTYVMMIVSFLIPDYVLRRWIYAIGFVDLKEAAPYLFSFAWTILFVIIVISLPQKMGKIVYSFLTIFWYIVASAQYIYYKIFDKMIWVKDITVAKEGSDFASYVIDKFDYRLFFLVFCCIFFVLYFCIFYKKRVNITWKAGVGVVLAVICLIWYTPKTLGEVGELNWDSWKNKRYVYECFNDQNKTMQISGLYQYTMRDIYQTFIKAKIVNNSTYEKLDSYYAEKEEFTSNNYTGLFEGKNVIVVMMESMDDWVINEKSTPTLNYMMDHGINFENYFAPIFGAGGTFNAEFTLNTGFHSPSSGNAAYAFNRNTFPYSLANVFKEDGYSVNSFHYNTGSFYNRTIMHETFGYDNHYAFLDMGYPEEEAIFDSIIFTDETLYDAFMKQEEPFLNFVVTYSNHLQYNLNNLVCNVNASEYPELWEESKDEEMNCLAEQTKETDKFFELMLKSLYKEGILEDTVIVAFADHKLYGMQQDVTAFNAESELGLEDCIPFFIYDYETENSMSVYKVINNTDLLPTILNLFGYQPSKYYLGSDAFDPNYQGYTFYSNYNWYDGVIYNDGTLDYVNDHIKEMNELVLERIEINNLVLEADYFAYLENKGIE